MDNPEELGTGASVLVEHEKYILKLCDFGVSRELENSATHVSEKLPIGTVRYMAPEVLHDCRSDGKLLVGKAADQWSIGVVLHQMLHQGLTPHSHVERRGIKVRLMLAIADENSARVKSSCPRLLQPSQSTGNPSHGNESAARLASARHAALIGLQSVCLQFSPKDRASTEDLVSVTEEKKRLFVGSHEHQLPSDDPTLGTTDIVGDSEDEVLVVDWNDVGTDHAADVVGMFDAQTDEEEPRRSLDERSVVLRVDRLRSPDGETWAQGPMMGVISDRDDARDHAEAERVLKREGEGDGHQAASGGNEGASGASGSNEGTSGASGGNKGAAGASVGDGAPAGCDAVEGSVAEARECSDNGGALPLLKGDDFEVDEGAEGRCSSKTVFVVGVVFASVVFLAGVIISCVGFHRSGVEDGDSTSSGFLGRGVGGASTAPPKSLDALLQTLQGAGISANSRDSRYRVIIHETTGSATRQQAFDTVAKFYRPLCDQEAKDPHLKESLSDRQEVVVATVFGAMRSVGWYIEEQEMARETLMRISRDDADTKHVVKKIVLADLWCPPRLSFVVVRPPQLEHTTMMARACGELFKGDRDIIEKALRLFAREKEKTLTVPCVASRITALRILGAVAPVGAEDVVTAIANALGGCIVPVRIAALKALLDILPHGIDIDGYRNVHGDSLANARRRFRRDMGWVLEKVSAVCTNATHPDVQKACVALNWGRSS